MVIGRMADLLLGGAGSLNKVLEGTKSTGLNEGIANAIVVGGDEGDEGDSKLTGLLVTSREEGNNSGDAILMEVRRSPSSNTKEWEMRETRHHTPGGRTRSGSQHRERGCRGVGG